MSRVRSIIPGVLVLLVLLGTPRAEAKKPNVFLGCETYSVRNLMVKENPAQGQYDMVTVMKLFKDLGMKGVSINEMWMKSYEDKAYLDQIKQAAKDNGLIITSFICRGIVATLDDAAWKKQIEQDKLEMRAAAYLGAPLVRINLGSTGDPAKDGTAGVDRCIAAFKELIPLAKELKVKLMIENHGGVSGKADYILRIINGTDPKMVGVCLDFNNFPKQPKDLLYEECAKVAPYVVHAHAKSHEFGPDGEETVLDYGRILKILRDAKYKGAISIEFEGKGDQIEGVKKTRDLILKYWKI